MIDDPRTSIEKSEKIMKSRMNGLDLKLGDAGEAMVFKLAKWFNADLKSFYI